ncbi:MAG: sulfatase [Nitrospirota bacterium]|nr:sulfatase [Nitrospirota bacterium]
MSRLHTQSSTRQILTIIALGLFVGNIICLVTAIWVVLENEYLGQGMMHLAVKTIAARTFMWTLWGALGGAVIAAAAAIAVWFGARLASERRVLIGAVTAVPIVAFYLGAGLYLNRYYLPGFFELPSIAANIGLTLLGAGLWYTVMVLSMPLVKTSLPRGYRWLQGWAPIVFVSLVLGLTQGADLLVAPSRKAPRTNVIILLVDALRYERLGAYGYYRSTSPNINALLRDGGWIFTQAVAPASWTKPSVASLFTALYPYQHGIDSGAWGRTDDKGATRVDVLLPGLTTLAEVMADAGYNTVALGCNVHLLPRFGFAQGFETYEMGLTDENSISAPKIHNRFFNWLNGHEQGFFAYFHYIDVHWPYSSPPPFAGMYSGLPSSVDYNSREIIAKAQHGGIVLDDEVVTHMSDAYDEQIQFLDAEIGKLIKELKSRGLYDETLIILTADHGEEFMEHGHFTHGTSLYDVLLRVPLIIKFPCPGPNCYQRKVDEQVEIIDIMPTILRQVGLFVARPIEGRDLTAQKRDKKNPAFSARADDIAMRTNEFKYIYSPIDQSEEFYDLQADPGEMRNIALDYPELTASFQAQLLDWMAATKPDRDVKRREVVLDKKTLRELQSLGYVK